MKVTVEITPPRLPARRRSRLIVGAALALALLLPATAMANHIFSDVPTTMTGHSAIEALYDARVTGGCSATTYCPTAAVTREQMALFLQRGLGRVTFSSDQIADAVTDVDTVQNSVVLRTGGTAGGTQFIKADVSYSGNVTGITGCPCNVIVFLSASSGGSSDGIATTVDSLGFFSGSATFAFGAPTGSNITISASAVQDQTTSAIVMYADISAISGAYGSQGTDVGTPPLGGNKRWQ
jgi:hypothetical protein